MIATCKKKYSPRRILGTLNGQKIVLPLFGVKSMAFKQALNKEKVIC
jgi:hypothetical protein